MPFYIRVSLRGDHDVPLVMRLGKFMENAQAALRALSAPGETGERITAIGRQLGYFGYLSLDNIVWVRAIAIRIMINAC